VPVADLQLSSRWYEALFGRAADNNPMPTLVEWQVLPGAWVRSSPTVLARASGC